MVATKKNLFGDTIVISDKTLFRNERKDIIFQDDKTIQGYTVARATGEIIPNVKIDINIRAGALPGPWCFCMMREYTWRDQSSLLIQTLK